MHDWQNDTETAISHYKREESVPPAQFQQYSALSPKSTGFYWVRLSPKTFASSVDTLDKQSYTGQKLVHMAPNTLYWKHLYIYEEENPE